MADVVPALGADIILEFQQSINNVQMFGQAMEMLDSRFGAVERRVDSLRSSLSSMSSQVSKGSGRDLRSNLESELNNLIASNGVVVGKLGTAPLRVKADTIRDVMSKVESQINIALATAMRNLQIEINPSLHTGKLPIDKDDFNEVNKAIARLVRVQLNNLVAAIKKHGTGLISADDLSAIQMNIGKDTAQHIVNKVKRELQKVLINPKVDVDDVKLSFTERDMSRLMTVLKRKINESINLSIRSLDNTRNIVDLTPKMKMIYEKMDYAVNAYVRGLSNDINAMGSASIKTPIDKLSKQLRRFISREMNVDFSEFQRAFAGQKLSVGEVQSWEIRRQFERLEKALNKKIGGGLNTEIKEMVKQIEGAQISYSPKLKYHLANQINRVNNAIVKKIREQIDLQFSHMLAEINSVTSDPKDIKRIRRIRDMGRLHFDSSDDRTVGRDRKKDRNKSEHLLANDPYARRDNYMNGFGIQGAVVNTLRHILAGSVVGAPMMLMYQAWEQFKTSQLEQVKMFSNLFAQASANQQERSAKGDDRDAQTVATETMKELVPFTDNAAQFYAIDKGKMSEITSVGSRLLDTPGEIKTFTDIVGKIYNIDREGDPVSIVAPGLEAFMGQFDLAVGELEEKVVKPLAVATNVTNATTEQVMQALMRSGSTFKEAGATPEQAIAMVATSIKYTGLSGENIGNFYKSILPRLQSPSSLKALEDIGVSVYDESKGFKQAKSAASILEEVAFKYEGLDDPIKRQVIQNIFGTYQSAKGATTLDEFEEFRNIEEAMRGFSKDDFDQLMANNTQAPIIEMQRAGVTVTLALTSLLEQMTPEIVAVSQGITNLTSGIREHKEALAEFIKFLASSALGYAGFLAGRKLYNVSGAPQAIERVGIQDKLYGNDSRVQKWQRTGILEGLQGVNGVRPEILTNTKENRVFMNQALQNPVLENHVKSLASMSDDQIKNMKAYITDNNLLVKDMKDLIVVADESKGYEQKKQLTDQEKWGQSQYNANKLHKDGMAGLDKNFMHTVTSDLRDKAKFDALGKTSSGGKVIGFLSELNEQQLESFQKHIDDLHKSSGVVIKDMDGMARAVDSYVSTQAVNREELRRTNPEIRNLAGAIDDVHRNMNRATSGNAMNNFNSFLGGLSQRTRGAVSALGGLARTVGGFAGQMLLFAGFGEIMGNVAYSVTATKDEKALKSAEKSMKDQQRISDLFDDFTDENYHWFDTTITNIGKNMGRDFAGAWDFVTSPFTDEYFDSGEADKLKYDIYEYAKKKYGLNINPSDAYSGGWYSGQIERDFVKQLNDKNLTVDDVLKDMNKDNGDQSVQEIYKKAQRELLDAKYKETIKNSIEMASVTEELDRKEKERQRKDRLAGKYAGYDLDTVKKSLGEDVKKIEVESNLNSLKMVLGRMEGTTEKFATDSEAYVNERIRLNNKIIKMYQDELDNIKRFISNYEQEISTAKKNGEDAQVIKEMEDNLARWKQNQKDAESEFGNIQMQKEQENIDLNFNASLSRISRQAALNEAKRNKQEIVNGLTMDRSSREYIDASIGNSQGTIKDLQEQLNNLRNVSSVTADQKNQLEIQMKQLENTIAQEQLKVKDLRLSRIGIYKEDLSDRLASMSNDYMKAKVDAGLTDDNNPYLKNLRVDQYNEQVSMFGAEIKKLQDQLTGANSEEAKQIQREIRDLQRQQYQAQLGILEEMKNTGGTFNLPDNVKAMTYYEYITRNNSHSTYTVQGGDTNIQITLPNVTDGTSPEKLKQIGKSIGEGINEGHRLRPQMLMNPYGYRTPV
ncbi:phage tail tape measure protein [Brevibacillus laterosporus]|uniref:phage tail tape measure protein n=1 Tax=Brevibacillus laterosporus TaxID=1465 RepID=UPI003D21C6CD